MTRLARALSFGAALALASPLASAQAYPSGPLTLIIPLAAGDATDTAARAKAIATNAEPVSVVMACTAPSRHG